MNRNRLSSDAALVRRGVAALHRRLRAQDKHGDGIGPTGLGILARLRQIGVASAGEIAQVEGVQPQSLTRALAALEEAGMIERDVDEHDRRRNALAITAKGERFLRTTIRKRVTWLSRVMEARLTPDERATLRSAALLMERLAGGGGEAARPPDAVFNLIPYAHVADVERSLAFYAHLGFVEDGRHEHDGQLVWGAMHARALHSARIFFAIASEPVDPRAQAVLFYCWTDDIVTLHARLKHEGLAPGKITHPAHMQDGEFRLIDPDGYVVLVGQVRRES